MSKPENVVPENVVPFERIKNPPVKKAGARLKDSGKKDEGSGVLPASEVKLPSQELLNFIGALIAKDLLSRFDSLDQNVRNIRKELDVVKTTVVKISENTTREKKIDESANVEFVTIQFSDPTQRSSAYECLTKFGVIYERLLFSCANVQKEGLKVLTEGRFEFNEVDYSDLLNRDKRGEELRQTYLRAQRTRLGYDV